MADKNTMRQSSKYLFDLNQVYNNYTFPVFQRYDIVVCPQKSFKECLNDYPNIFEKTDINECYNIIYVLDYHKNGDTIPFDEHICMLSKVFGKPHGSTNDAHCNILYDIMDDHGTLIKNPEKNNKVCGVLKRNGTTEHAPLDELISLINSRIKTYHYTNATVFPPVFYIHGYFIEDMITEIAIELRKKFPNSKIDISDCYSICNKGKYDSGIDTYIRDALMSKIDSAATVVPSQVLDDLAEINDSSNGSDDGGTANEKEDETGGKRGIDDSDKPNESESENEESDI